MEERCRGNAVTTRFVRAKGKRAAIGELSELNKILAGEAGTTIDATGTGIKYAT